jgi:hypothetical protein
MTDINSMVDAAQDQIDAYPSEQQTTEIVAQALARQIREGLGIDPKLSRLMVQTQEDPKLLADYKRGSSIDPQWKVWWVLTDKLDALVEKLQADGYQTSIGWAMKLEGTSSNLLDY